MITLQEHQPFDFQLAVGPPSSAALSLKETMGAVREGIKAASRQRGTLGILEAGEYHVDNRIRRFFDIAVRQVLDKLLELNQGEGVVSIKEQGFGTRICNDNYHHMY